MTNLQRSYANEILGVLYAIASALFWTIGWKVVALLFIFLAFVGLLTTIKYSVRAGKPGEL